jgi:hypothetical protein
MLLLYKNVACPICKGHHDFCVEESSSCMVLKAHDFICPATGQRIIWHPDVFAHPIKQAPQNAIRLLSHVDSQ